MIGHLHCIVIVPHLHCCIVQAPAAHDHKGYYLRDRASVVFMANLQRPKAWVEPIRASLVLAREYKRKRKLRDRLRGRLLSKCLK